ncbi:MAG: protein kinase [Deltaproteobacteria bacterium]|jgi:serine/threonine-protein kinase|nr:protein kinase [Deltaproteobacteria bacterium]MBW2529860.1 protein kinase [Deltaproteobacteria bacterium]
MESFLGRYELLGLIATGGMGKVYLARSVGEGGFEREVALKVMHEHLLYEPDFIAMFLDEARLAASIRHPNVVPTLDIEKTATSLFLVMELVEGLTASSLLKQLRRRTRADGRPPPSADHGISDGAAVSPAATALPPPIAGRIVVDALGGLHAAHELVDRTGQPLQLVHRDVSPGNVLIGTDGIARITDFGVARAETRLTSTMGGQVKGKLPYMPPEQIMADRVDRRADVYSAAVVLWELLAGRRLFDADQQGALIRSVLQGAVSGPRGIIPSVPAALDAVCLQALATDPTQRFATAEQFAEALDEALTREGSHLASAREVAAYVSGFGTNLSSLHDARRAAPRSSSSGLEIPLPTATDSAPSIGSISVPTLSSAGPTRTAAVVSTVSDRPAPRGLSALAWMAGGAGLALVAGLLGAVAVFSTGAGAETGSESAAPAAQPPAVPAPPPSAPSRRTSLPKEAPTAVPSASPSAEAEDPEPTRSPRRPEARTPRPAPRATRKPRSDPADEPLPSEFLPGEL